MGVWFPRRRQRLRPGAGAAAAKTGRLKMRLISFTVEGYKNLTAAVTLGPLGGVNALHGANNVGKSNLIAAIDLFFGLLAIGGRVSKDQFAALDANEAVPGHPFAEIFTVLSPATIR